LLTRGCGVFFAIMRLLIPLFASKKGMSIDTIDYAAH